MARYVYRRVQLRAAVLSPTLADKTLQKHVEEAIASLPNLDSSEYPSAQFGAVRLNGLPTASKNGGICLKIVGHAPGELATTVPIKAAGASLLEGAAKAPDSHSFKNGDFFLIIRDNLLCGVGDQMRFESATKYIRELLVKQLKNPAHAALDMTEVFSYDAAQQLCVEGVREIEFEASLYAATIDKAKAQAKNKGPVRKLLDGLIEEAQALYGDDVDAKDLAEVRVAVSVSVAGGVRGHDDAKQFVQQTATSLLAADAETEPGVQATIVTRQGNRVSIGDSTVGETFKISRRHNESSMVDAEVWEALEKFDAKVLALGDLKT